jgi:hypothetical protein
VTRAALRNLPVPAGYANWDACAVTPLLLQATATAESPEGLHSQTCANISDQPCALTVTELHELQSVIPIPPD